jgi:hypothetical protein
MSKNITPPDMAPTNTDFICHAFRDATNEEQPWVTGFPGDPLDIEHRLWGGRGALPLPWFIRPEHNNYIAVSSFKRGTDDTFRRRKDNFSRMHLVMVDDVGTKVPHAKLVLAPSAVVETSPGNYQAWYFLNPPEADRGRAERLIDGMVATGLTADASDPGMKGVTRYGRLPVGINGKAKYVEKLGQPFVQRVDTWAPWTRYSTNEVAAAYGVAMTGSPARPQRRSAKAPLRTTAVAGAEDGFVDLLDAAGLYMEAAPALPDAHRIVCPWVHQHTDEDPSGTVYFEPSDQNDWRGGFKCHHGHCQARTVVDLTHFLISLQEFSAKVQP